MNPVLRLGLIVATISVAIDQVFKIQMVEFMASHPYGIDVTSFFRLVMVWNSGVSFGMFAGGEVTRWILIGVSLLICLVLVIWMARTQDKLLGLSLGLVLGGALGNVIDRLHYGRVADFFDVDLIFMRWPAFNIADMCIVGGVLLMLVQSLFFDENSSKKDP
ncbi:MULTISPECIES: signal peptidase II [Sneathiella]|uniref:signal peptidase II n=1 Tax=Sneathiella TaxID=510690 RepID=UPI00146A28D7|nr:signal peptidase II [Sneathiella aquimaris]